MNKELEEFKYLWTKRRRDYVLVKDELAGGGVHFLIFNVVHRTAKVIEDDEIHTIVVKRMRDAGVPVVDKLPPE